MQYLLMARIKSVFRWLAFHLGTADFVSYSEAARDTSGYEGWYEVHGRVIAFRRTRGRDQFVW